MNYLHRILRVAGCLRQGRTMQADPVDLRGKHILVTGGSSGIGAEVTKTVAAWGGHVLLACRSQDKGQRLIDTIMNRDADAAVTLLADADTADLKSMARLAESVTVALDGACLDGLVLNAGVAQLPWGISPQGYELHAATNVLGHHLLVRRLLPFISKSNDGRVVYVTGDIYVLTDDCTLDYRYRSGRVKAYARSKLGVIWNALSLHEKKNHLGASGVKSIVVHPGVVATNLMSGFDALKRRLLITPEQGAQTTLIALARPDVRSGSYIHNVYGEMTLRESDPARHSQRRQAFWAACEEVIKSY